MLQRSGFRHRLGQQTTHIFVLKHPTSVCNFPAKWLLRCILHIHLRPLADGPVALDASGTDKVQEGFSINGGCCLVNIEGRNSPTEELR